MEKNRNRHLLARETELYLANRFKEGLGNLCEVIRGYRDSIGRSSDIAILFNRSVVAFVECKSDASAFKDSIGFYSWLDLLFSTNESKFCFVADKTRCYLFARGDYGVKELSIEEAIMFIKDQITRIGPPPSFDEIVSVLYEVSKKHKMSIALRSLIENLRQEDIVIDSATPTYSFSFTIEDALFKSLLGDLSSTSFCRYAPLNSLFDLLNGEKQNMCNIVCMNDRGEYRYADEYVYGIIPQIGSKDFAELDLCFVLSLLDDEKKDDLTMWRLYGEDAKGVCISYRLVNDALTSSGGQFFLANVSYGQKNGKHPKLEFIKSLLTALKIRGWSLNLKRWNIWKHFFKTYHFAVEKEIRLMYYDTPKTRSSGEFIWIKNPDSQIVSKMQLFDFKSFPLSVKDALVGPKCHEKDLLARQFKTMADSTSSFKRVSIIYSRIDDYR